MDGTQLSTNPHFLQLKNLKEFQNKTELSAQNQASVFKTNDASLLLYRVGTWCGAVVPTPAGLLNAL